MNLTYNETKSILGLKHDYNLKITDLFGTILAEKGINYTMLNATNSTDRQSVSIERKVIYQGTESTLSLLLWD